MKNLLVIIFLFLSYSTKAQISAVTEKGDTILVFDNGTWKKLSKKSNITPITSNVNLKIEVDEFSGDKKMTTETWERFGLSESKSMINGYVYQGKDIPVFYIRYFGDLGCLSQYRSSMKVKLTNGEIIDFTQITKTECGDNEIAGFIPISKDELESGEYKGILSENLSTLKSYDWETIRIQGTEYYSDIKPAIGKTIPKPQQFFREHLIAIESN